ncbi:uncharacterized protein LOC130741430 [Lotus japonicus]|uniref:uncharacterized protein LOC130741430 n=1 Tax=Lotus japonicus TaxID=34305 RepID=UPI00258FB85F|nr:uncharacterized protein LOC130741430 [Lotus japonicus]
MGFGMIIRNSHGQMLASASSEWPAAASSSLAEAMALRWSLHLAHDLGFEKIEVETDSLVVFQARKRMAPSYSYLAVLISECYVVSRLFRNFNLDHVRRTSNQAADFLAMFALSHYCFVGIEECSFDLNDILSSDLVVD